MCERGGVLAIEKIGRILVKQMEGGVGTKKEKVAREKASISAKRGQHGIGKGGRREQGEGVYCAQK